MRKKIIVLILVMLFIVSICSTILARSEVKFSVDKKEILIDNEFTLSVNVEDAQIAAYTIWIYFDTEKLECLEKKDSINIIGNKIIYTWFSEAGKNQEVEKIIDLKFKAKQEGSVLFSLVGEFYGQNGKKIDMKYNQLEIQIGQKDNIAKIEADGTENNLVRTEEKNNANLEIMRLNQEGIEPDFSPNITEYYLVVDEKIKNLDIIAIPANIKADVKISGNENLKKGLNTIKILVTSEDKTKRKEYIINVTKTNNVDSANTDLETLAIENVILIPEYQANITDYSVEVSKDTNELNILAVPSDEDARVEIIGEKRLKTGDNSVKIVVTARNGITTKDYKINVHKRTDNEEVLKKQEQIDKMEESNQIMKQKEKEEGLEKIENEEETKQDKHNVISIIGVVLAIMVIGITVLRIVKRRK